MILIYGKKRSTSLLQEDPEEKMMKLDHVLEKLRKLDPKTFGMLNNMLDTAKGGESFLQVGRPVGMAIRMTTKWRPPGRLNGVPNDVY